MTIKTKFSAGDTIAYINEDTHVAEGVVDYVAVLQYTDHVTIIYDIKGKSIREEDAWSSREALLDHLTTPY